MSARRVFSLKFIAFAVTPTFVLLLAAETTFRLKYFFSHGHDWGYLVTPFPPRLPDITALWTSVRSADRPTSPQQVGATGRTPLTNPSAPTRQPAPTDQPPPTRQATTTDSDAPTTQAAPIARTVDAAVQPERTRSASRDEPTTSAAAKDQMVFTWLTPCVNAMVYSTELRKEMPRTWDENCFRGDRATPQKDPSEYRIVFVGGSTVEDGQSDAEMMTTQFKDVLPPTYRGKKTRVINAGKSGFDSRRILDLYKTTLSRFSPDLVLYYEAWNEQPTDIKPRARAGLLIGRFRNRLHQTLYFRSLLYTYLVEKYAFLKTSSDRFWKIDVNVLRRNFVELAREVQSRGGRFVFVTQVVRFSRTWKNVDTFDHDAVDRLLDRLRADRQYVYDVNEISALNQRLAVFYTIDLCREHNIPVINILEPIEALGESGRAELFMDLGHLTVKGDQIVGELIGKRLNLDSPQTSSRMLLKVSRASTSRADRLEAERRAFHDQHSVNTPFSSTHTACRSPGCARSSVT